VAEVKGTADEIDAIMADLDATGAAWQAAGYPFDGPEADAREAVFRRLRAWNEARAARSGRPRVEQEASCRWAHGPTAPELLDGRGLCPVCAEDEDDEQCARIFPSGARCQRVASHPGECNPVPWEHSRG
jgi:hypothetical protein